MLVFITIESKEILMEIIEILKNREFDRSYFTDFNRTKLPFNIYINSEYNAFQLKGWNDISKHKKITIEEFKLYY